MQSKAYILRRAAALRRLLRVGTRTLNRPNRGGRRALQGFNHGLPNKSLQRSADSGNFIRKVEGLMRCVRAR